MGDANGAAASGSTGDGSIGTNDVMSIASASKWLYSSYWVQKVGGPAGLSASDLQFFNLQSGYTDFSSCSAGRTGTVAECLDLPSSGGQTNGTLEPSTVGFFDYGGGHMQKHAALNGLGGLKNGPLADEIVGQIGTEIRLAYSEPQLAGGAVISAAEYAKLLRKIVGGQLAMHDALGVHPVCTDTTGSVCPTALSSPAPRGEQWHYSIGHWVEDDPVVGDGAFSSPGAFGFYPWVDASRHWYGIVARTDPLGALTSVYCGRLIRKAWLSGTAQ